MQRAGPFASYSLATRVVIDRTTLNDNNLRTSGAILNHYLDFLYLSWDRLQQFNQDWCRIDMVKKFWRWFQSDASEEIQCGRHLDPFSYLLVSSTGRCKKWGALVIAFDQTAGAKALFHILDSMEHLAWSSDIGAKCNKIELYKLHNLLYLQRIVHAFRR
jgi:hypothetical protein